MTRPKYASKDRCLKNLQFVQSGLTYALRDAEQLLEQDLADDLWEIQVVLTRVIDAAQAKRYRSPGTTWPTRS